MMSNGQLDNVTSEDVEKVVATRCIHQNPQCFHFDAGLLFRTAQLDAVMSLFQSRRKAISIPARILKNPQYVPSSGRQLEGLDIPINCVLIN